MAEDVLTLTGVNKHFGTTHALRDVSFSVASGEIHALLGENGAGKSTLIKIVTGVLAPDDGTAVVLGTPVPSGHPDQMIRAGLSTVYQDLSLIPGLTAAANLDFGRPGLLRPVSQSRRAAAKVGTRRHARGGGRRGGRGSNRCGGDRRRRRPFVVGGMRARRTQGVDDGGRLAGQLLARGWRLALAGQGGAEAFQLFAETHVQLALRRRDGFLAELEIVVRAEGKRLVLVFATLAQGGLETVAAAGMPAAPGLRPPPALLRFLRLAKQPDQRQHDRADDEKRYAYGGVPGQGKRGLQRHVRFLVAFARPRAANRHSRFVP